MAKNNIAQQIGGAQMGSEDSMPMPVQQEPNPSMWNRMKSDGFRKNLMSAGQAMSGNSSGGDMMSMALQNMMANKNAGTSAGLNEGMQAVDQKMNSGSGLLNVLKNII